jgi:hypothetical protein
LITDALNSAQAAIDKQLSNAADAVTKERNNYQVAQNQSTTIPMAAPTQVQPVNPQANVSTTNNSYNNTASNVIISQPFTQSNNINTSMNINIYYK